MSSSDKTTNTSQWSLVIHRVSATTAEVWVGTLFPTLKMPELARVVLTHPDGKTTTKQIKKSQWLRPFNQLKQRFYKVITFTDLKPGKEFDVVFSRRIEAQKERGEEVLKQSWQNLRTGSFKTLPSRIPAQGEKPFTIALSSCFYNHRDGGRAAAAFKSLYNHGADKVKPDIKFMSGDQVYLDIGFDSLSFIPSEIRQRIADDYALHWQALGSLLSNGGTWMLPDDHEYWNDFPNYKSNIPQLQALRLSSVRKAWHKASLDAVNNIQRSAKVESFTIGNDLSICLADLRTFRNDRGFTSAEFLQKIVEWAEGLTQPGVFVSPQPLIVDKNKTENNLLSYKAQYSELLKALASSGHDIVLLSGDVHFGRISSVPLSDNKTNGPRLIEIISSPLSNLTYLNGIATAKPKCTPKRFPPRDVQKVMGLSKAQEVVYSKHYNVSTKSGNIFSAYPLRRTNEHFMTVHFLRLPTGKLQLVADAWRVRKTRGNKGLPVKDFSRSYRTQLK